MLNINVKFVARELAKGLENGDVGIENGTTIRDLIKLCADRSGSAVPPEDNLKRMYPMFNGKPVVLDYPLTQDGTLHICRIAMGG